MERPALNPKGGGSYFAASEKENIEFINSGCKIFDCALGGGYPIGRIINVVGDRSAGKTLLAIEACANFHFKYPDDKIWYREAEQAFDEDYAAALGMPVDYVDFGSDEEGKRRMFYTVEDLFEDTERCIEEAIKGQRGLYIIDSLDAVSDRAEQARKIDEGSYGANKAKMVSEWYRRQNQNISDSGITQFVISQTRDKIGVGFGEKYSRSGGRALDFYASQIILLSHIGQLKRTVKGVERVYGVKIRAKIKKNKVGLPFREVDFPILFGFGIDDLVASLEWLVKVKRTEDAGLTEAEAKKLAQASLKMESEEYEENRKKINAVVGHVWQDIEESFLPKKSKYGS